MKRSPLKVCEESHFIPRVDIPSVFPLIESSLYHVGDLVEGTVKSVLGYGIFLDIRHNVAAFVPVRYVSKTPLIGEKVFISQ
jgi:hypothetical protein